jgi:hypothetical protein
MIMIAPPAAQAMQCDQLKTHPWSTLLDRSWESTAPAAPPPFLPSSSSPRAADLGWDIPRSYQFQSSLDLNFLNLNLTPVQETHPPSYDTISQSFPSSPVRTPRWSVGATHPTVTYKLTGFQADWRLGARGSRLVGLGTSGLGTRRARGADRLTNAALDAYRDLLQ